MPRLYCVYILSSLSRCLYVGVTGDLVRRVAQHRDRSTTSSAFSHRYRTRRLVYVEWTTSVHAALAREKAIKGLRRERKLELIEGQNRAWRDYAARWPVIELPD